MELNEFILKDTLYEFKLNTKLIGVILKLRDRKVAAGNILNRIFFYGLKIFVP